MIKLHGDRQGGEFLTRLASKAGLDSIQAGASEAGELLPACLAVRRIHVDAHSSLTPANDPNPGRDGRALYGDLHTVLDMERARAARPKEDVRPIAVRAIPFPEPLLARKPHRRPLSPPRPSSLSLSLSYRISRPPEPPPHLGRPITPALQSTHAHLSQEQHALAPKLPSFCSQARHGRTAAWCLNGMA